MKSAPHVSQEVAEERWGILRDLDEWLDAPMLVLSFVWLVLVVVELVYGGNQTLEVFGTAIWVVFLAEFAVRFSLAPGKLSFLRGNWLTVVALVAPAVRLLRGVQLLRFARGARGLRLVRIIGTANRGMNALRKSFRRRGLGYVLGSTVLVILLGAAGMLAFEPAHEVKGGFASYGHALWWTAMLMTSIGSDFWPRTIEGRILCFLLSVYGFAMFGYITAAFASFFVERDAAAPDSETLSSGDLLSLRADIAALRTELAASTHSG